MPISRKGRPTGRKLGDCTHARLLPSGQCGDCGSVPGCGHELREAEDGWLACVRPGCAYRRSVKAPLLVTVDRLPPGRADDDAEAERVGEAVARKARSRAR